MCDEDPRKIISSLLISSPKGVTLFKLLQEYREFTGQDVPFRQMGFPSFEHYIQSIPETCRVTGTGRDALVIPVVNAQNKHINEMILKQKAPKSNPRSRFKNIRRSRGIYDYNTSYESNYVPQPEPKPKPKYDDFKLPDLMPDSHLKVLPPPPDYINDIRREQCKQKIKQTVIVNENQASTSKTSTVLNSDNLLNSMHHDIAAALSEESDYDEYFNELNYDNDDDDDGFYYKSDTESVDLSSSVNNLVVSVANETSIPMIDPEENSRPDHVSRVNDNVKEKLRLLISDHPDGIWCSKLLKMYRERFKQPLDPLEFGFASVIQLCDDIPDVFHCIRPCRSDWKLYDSRRPVPDVHSMRDLSKYLQSLSIVNPNYANAESALPNNLVTFNPSYKYPETVLHPDEKIERLKLPDDDQIDEFVEVIVAEVYDPSKFWIQFKGEETFDALEALMDTMQIFYMHNAGALQLNEFSVRIGLFVAALFLNEYHRAVVIKVFNDETLKVFYVDYGTVGEVPLRKTCLLHRDFASLPQQAIRSRLDNIVPIEQNTMWPREASQFMLNMVMDKTLFGLIRRIDRDQQILHLILTDTTQEMDIHINDELVNSGYAALGNEAPICSTSSAIVPNVHLYPSFEEIENFIYPNVGDVIRMLKIGHTYETIFHGYFNNNSSCTQTPITNSRCNNHDEEEEEIMQNDSSESDIFICESPSPMPSPTPSTETIEVRKKCVAAPPPGFENVKPNVDNFKQTTIQTIPAIPAISTFNNAPSNEFNQILSQSSLLHLAMVNPLLYNQMLLQREILLQQQREALLNQQRTALFQHQFEEFQRIITSKNNASTTVTQGSKSPSPKNMYDHLVESKTDNNNDDCSSNKSEQITRRNVIKLDFDHFHLHVIKIEDNYYLVTQEIITTLLNSNLTFKSWLQQNNLTLNSFPNKLINLSNHEGVYNELMKFQVPGFYKANNLGCNTRVTLLHDVIDIIYKYGDRNMIPELRNSIKNATESQYLWEVLHSSD